MACCATFELSIQMVFAVKEPAHRQPPKEHRYHLDIIEVVLLIGIL